MPNPVKIAKKLKALPVEEFNQIILHTGDLKGLGSNPAEIIGPRKIIRKLAGRHVYLSPTESKGQRAVALTPNEFATMIHTYGKAGVDKSPPREVKMTLLTSGPPHPFRDQEPHPSTQGDTHPQTPVSSGPATPNRKLDLATPGQPTGARPKDSHFRHSSDPAEVLHAQKVEARIKAGPKTVPEPPYLTPQAR